MDAAKTLSDCMEIAAGMLETMAVNADVMLAQAKTGFTAATDVADYQVGAAAQYKPVVYNPSDRIYYQRTLVFPLQQAGKFNSRITNLEVKVVK